MGFSKNRSQRFWTFSSYSIVFHLGGFLSLLILIGPHIPGPPAPPIKVQLVDTAPVTSQSSIARVVETTPPIDQTVIPQTQTLPAPTSIPNFFHIRPTQTVASLLADKPLPYTSYSSRSLGQVAMNALVATDLSRTFAPTSRSIKMQAIASRVLRDRKASQELVSQTPAKILYNPEPPYPRVARELGLEGKTLLRVEILQDGRPGAIKVRKSCGHPVLDEAAAKAIRDWKFAPAHDGLFAVRSVVDLPIRFSLKSLG